MKHTPAPWEFKIDDCWLIEANGSSIMGSETYYPWVPSNKADWQLIAAAPELLEALQAAIECGMVPSMSARSGGACAHVEQLKVADKIRDAIAKATGADNGK